MFHKHGAAWALTTFSLLLVSTWLAPAVHAGSRLTLSGAGSTFDAPFLNAAFAAYAKHHQVDVNYQAIGSGAGITLGQNCQVDFWASDVPMDNAELALDRCGKVVQVPVTLGGAAIIYHLDHVSGLRLTGPVLANIHLGKISNWDDPKIRAVNPRKKLPDLHINVIHRSDSSGTSYIFADYLSHVSTAWKAQVGASKTPAWPTGTGVVKSGGVANVVKQISGAIGYVEVSYVLQNKLQAAQVENRAHRFTVASLAAVAADAAQFKHISSVHFSIVDGPGPSSYAISGYSWAITYQHQRAKPKGKALVKLLSWLVTSGQAYGPRLDYVMLPAVIRQLALKQLTTVQT